MTEIQDQPPQTLPIATPSYQHFGKGGTAYLRWVGFRQISPWWRFWDKRYKKVAIYHYQYMDDFQEIVLEWQDMDRTWTFGEMRMETIYDCPSQPAGANA